MKRTYVCEICHTINSANRIHCQTCGTVPARYSILAKPTNYDRLVETTVARGAVRTEMRVNPTKVYFKTVSHDYYAESVKI